MSVNLVKGQKISLVKDPQPEASGAQNYNAGGYGSGVNDGAAIGMAALAGAAMLAGARAAQETPLTRIVVGLGWDAAPRQAAQPQRRGLFGSILSSAHTVDIDCDASAILLQNGKFVSRDDIVYFGNLRHRSGAVWHHGDNLTGAGEGDDEQIEINLNNVPPQYDRIVIVVNIYAAEQRKQDFGMISNAFVRIVDGTNNRECLRFNLTDNYPGMTAMIFGEIYRHNGMWKFNAVGQGTRDGSLSELCRRFQ